jgi:hypothetical protein
VIPGSQILKKKKTLEPPVYISPKENGGTKTKHALISPNRD